MTLDPETVDVLTFRLKLDLPVETKPRFDADAIQARIKFLAEELDELVVAAANHDLAAIADALVDIVYVAKGAALILGLPWVELWDEVQRSNMLKTRGLAGGATGYKDAVLKPAGWTPPNLAAVLERHGWRRP